MSKNAQLSWERYKVEELARVTPILAELGFTLEPNQPHIEGERYLMQAVTTASGRKLILLARRARDKRRVVIKATRDPGGIRELVHERICRGALSKIHFAYHIFFSPEEILSTKRGGYTISVQAFIEQDKPFLERPVEEQFSLILHSFKAGRAHATTYGHQRFIAKTFGTMDGNGYLASYRAFQKDISEHPLVPETARAAIKKGGDMLEKHRETIEQYCGFLTHTDFVPHNFRIVGDNMYLLDHSSLRFGNKYEGWARFLNFMTFYNRPLEEALLFYMRNNRAEEEMLSLTLMRIYKLGELIWYHSDKLEKTSGDLRTLTQRRVEFWTSVLEAILGNTLVSEQIVREYVKTRDVLRSAEEHNRQKGLH